MLITASHFTVGAVLEEQSAAAADDAADEPAGVTFEEAFDAGLRMIIDGLARHAGRTAQRPGSVRDKRS